MQTRIVIFGLLVFLCNWSSAIAEMTPPYNLETLVDMALARSDQIVSQRAKIAEKDEVATQTAVWQNPTLELSTGVKFASPYVGPVFQAGVSQLFYFPGKQQLRREVAGFEKSLEEIRLTEAELGITTDLIRLAYEYAVIQRKAKFAEKRRNRVELIRGYLAGQIFASPNQKTTNIIVKQRLKGIAADEQKLHGSLQATLKQLRFYVDQTQGKSLEISVPWLKGKRPIEESLWIDRVLNNNSELASQRALAQKALKEKELSSKEALPDLTVSAFYAQETADQTERFIGVGVGIPLPILNQNQAEKRSKEAKMRAEEYQLSYKEKKIKTLVRKLIAEYTAGQKIVTEYSEESLKVLESQLQSIEREFRRNRADVLLFLELDMQAAESANRMFDAQLSLLDTIASLYFLARDKNLISELSNY